MTAYPSKIPIVRHPTPQSLAAGPYVVRWAPSRDPEISEWFPDRMEWVTRGVVWPAHDGPEVLRRAPVL